MKIFIHIICIFIAVILQTTLLPQIMLLGGMPNIVFLVTLSLIFINRADEAIWWLGIGGMLLEFISPVHFGYYFFPLLIVYLLINLLVKRFFANPSWYISMIFFFIFSIIFDVIWLVYNYSIDTYTIILANAVYNVILGVVIYYFFQFYYFPKEKIKI
ncbi:MAG: hypothetical protein ACD_58C00274G0002 [uncultured bacterium]|nr:MAG: hypothetical protein ACD_58C00274G0002 [uncultured bacterium]